MSESTASGRWILTLFEAVSRDLTAAGLRIEGAPPIPDPKVSGPEVPRVFNDPVGRLP